jgi:hypothetical protein
MSEEMKEMEKQMKAARIREKRTAPEPTAVPNVGVNPRKNKKQSENIPFY